jgi:hypothetical protein
MSTSQQPKDEFYLADWAISSEDRPRNASPGRGEDASPSLSFVRSPSSATISMPNTMSKSPDQAGHLNRAFPANPCLDRAVVPGLSLESTVTVKKTFIAQLLPIEQPLSAHQQQSALASSVEAIERSGKERNPKKSGFLDFFFLFEIGSGANR